jgi:hypothetical protein
MSLNFDTGYLPILDVPDPPRLVGSIIVWTYGVITSRTECPARGGFLSKA